MLFLADLSSSGSTEINQSDESIKPEDQFEGESLETFGENRKSQLRPITGKDIPPWMVNGSNWIFEIGLFQFDESEQLKDTLHDLQGTEINANYFVKFQNATTTLASACTNQLCPFFRGVLDGTARREICAMFSVKYSFLAENYQKIRSMDKVGFQFNGVFKSTFNAKTFTVCLDYLVYNLI